MRLLFTNYQLISGTGTEQVIRDLAVSFQVRQHQVAIYCPRLGKMAEQIRSQGIKIVSRLEAMPWKPKIIHGHHHVETLEALQAFPEARALFVCHDAQVWHDFPPRHPRLMAYVAVDLNCLERMKSAGISDVRIIGNWVDPQRFLRRKSLPSKPRRALIFSNYAKAGGAIEEIQAACREAGIDCSVVGEGVGNHVEKPEEILGDFDLVFARAKCALEAMATGAAVVLFHPLGCGPMITTRNMASCLPWNFGMRLITEPVLRGNIRRRMDLYDSKNALAVADWVRQKADMDKAMEAYQKFYDELLAHPLPLEMSGHLDQEGEFPPENSPAVEMPPGPSKKLEPQVMQAVSIHVRQKSIQARTGENFPVLVEIVNDSSETLSSEQPFPVNVSYHWLDAPGQALVFDGQRTQLAKPLAPGCRTEIWVVMTAPELEGSYRLRMTCVQEKVLWFDELPTPVFAEMEIAVRPRQNRSGIFRILRQKAAAFRAAPQRPPMPIIVGSPRSGTTILRFMLDAHPELAIPPETNFLCQAADLSRSGLDLRLDMFDLVTQHAEEAPSWPDFELSKEAYWNAIKNVEPFDKTTGFREFYRLYARANHKSRCGDKTPLYALHIPAIKELLPEARFVHIIRDGRDVALSFRKFWCSPGESMEIQAKFWSDTVTTCRTQGLKCGHYLEVHYEQLITDPLSTLRRICDFIELRFDPQMMSYVENTPKRLKELGPRILKDGIVVPMEDQQLRLQQLTTSPPDISRIHVWRQEMTPEETMCFEAIAGETLRAFGYELAT